MGKFLRSLSRRLRRKSSQQPVATVFAGQGNVASTSRENSATKPLATTKPPASVAAAVVRQPSSAVATPPSRPFDPRNQCQCKVLLLDGADISIVVGRKVLGQEIYDRVFEYLDLYERDYFGLQFTDHYHVHHWLDPLKKISKQVPIGPPYTFRFHVKFYSSEPSNLREELTRYQFFLQLKTDIQSGALPCPKSTAIELAALALQSEFGDFNAREHTPVFVSQMRFHPLQDAAMECAVCEAYGALPRGQSPADAELAYLNRVKWLELYGVDMHIVEGKDGNQYRLGLTPTGMLVFDGEQKIGLFFWEKIQRLDFRNRKLTLIVEEDFEEGTCGQIQLHTFVFELTSHKACKHLWKCAIEHHTFFRLKHHKPPQRATGQLFRLGSTFKYRGRTEYENVHRELMVGDNAAKAESSRSASAHFERRSSQRYVPRQSHLAKQRLRDDVRGRVAACGLDACINPTPTDGAVVDPVTGPTHIADTIMRAYCGAKPRVAPLAGMSSVEDASSLEDGAPADSAVLGHSSPSGTSSSGIGSSCCMSVSGGRMAPSHMSHTTAAISTVQMNGSHRPSSGHVTTIAIEKSCANGGTVVATLSDYDGGHTTDRKEYGGGVIAESGGNGNNNFEVNEKNPPPNPITNTDALINHCTNHSNLQMKNKNTIDVKSSCEEEPTPTVIKTKISVVEEFSDEHTVKTADTKIKLETVSQQTSLENATDYDISTVRNQSQFSENPSITVDESGKYDPLPSPTTDQPAFRSITGAYQHGISTLPNASPCNSKSKIVRFCNMNTSNTSLATNSSDGRMAGPLQPRSSSATATTRRRPSAAKENGSGSNSAIPRPSHRHCSPNNLAPTKSRDGTTIVRRVSRIPAVMPRNDHAPANVTKPTRRPVTRRSPAPGADRSAIPTLKSNY